MVVVSHNLKFWVLISCESFLCSSDWKIKFFNKAHLKKPQVILVYNESLPSCVRLEFSMTRVMNRDKDWCYFMTIHHDGLETINLPALCQCIAFAVWGTYKQATHNLMLPAARRKRKHFLLCFLSWPIR